MYHSVRLKNKSFLKPKFLQNNSIFQIEKLLFHTTTVLAAPTTDYYAILLLDKNADKHQIKAAYYKLSKQYHPDINQEKSAEEKFKTLQEAYHHIGDEQRKKEYDVSLRPDYYDARSGSRANQSGNPFNGDIRNRSRRTASASGTGGDGFHHGKTSSYDFDEYYRSHYQKKRPDYSSFNASSQYSSSNPNLNSYWTQFDAKQSKELRGIQTRRRTRLFTILFGIIFMYIFTYQSQRRERKREGKEKEKNSRNAFSKDK